MWKYKAEEEIYVGVRERNMFIVTVLAQLVLCALHGTWTCAGTQSAVTQIM
jgi:hypothetical protein